MCPMPQHTDTMQVQDNALGMDFGSLSRDVGESDLRLNTILDLHSTYDVGHLRSLQRELQKVVGFTGNVAV